MTLRDWFHLFTKKKSLSNLGMIFFDVFVSIAKKAIRLSNKTDKDSIESHSCDTTTSPSNRNGFFAGSHPIRMSDVIEK